MSNLGEKHTKLLNLMADIRGDLEAINSPAAPMFATLMTKQEVFAQTYLHDLHGIETTGAKAEHPLEAEFRRLWKTAFPAYGNLVGGERKQIHWLFSGTIKSAFPQANAVFLERVINNFKLSTADWVVRNQDIALFCRHFRRFVNSPVGRGEPQEERSLHGRLGL